MPIYEYTCVTCSNRFDKRRSMSQMNDPASCPDCGSESRRVLSLYSPPSHQTATARPAQSRVPVAAAVAVPAVLAPAP